MKNSSSSLEQMRQQEK
ncbi:hypothetical protein Gotur_025231 [Gossypium turneri]